jgi:hypothetical protein
VVGVEAGALLQRKSRLAFCPSPPHRDGVLKADGLGSRGRRAAEEGGSDEQGAAAQWPITLQLRRGPAWRAHGACLTKPVRAAPVLTANALTGSHAPRNFPVSDVAAVACQIARHTKTLHSRPRTKATPKGREVFMTAVAWGAEAAGGRRMGWG